MKVTKRTLTTLAVATLFGLTFAGVAAAGDDSQHRTPAKVRVYIGNYAGQHQERASPPGAFQFRGREDNRYSGYRFRPIRDFTKRTELSAGASAFPQLRITF